MKILKIVHSTLAIVPFIWLLSFLYILIVGIIHFGYIPHEGNPVDPYKLGLDNLNMFVGIMLGVSLLTTILWVLISIVCTVFLRGKFSLNKISTILFFIGVFGFLIFRYIFPDVFGWVLD